MPQDPCVTVLMTVYNGLPYLREAIDSVLDQTFTDFELLIIDDGSTDDSIACIRSFTDPRLRLVCNERNVGQAWALNKGLTLSRGRYVARLDQDDVCLPDRLRREVELLDRQPNVAVVGTWMYRISDEGQKTGVLGMRVDSHGAFLGWLLSTASPIGHPTVMYRREVVTEVGGYEPSFSPCEDYDLWCRLALHHYRVDVITEPLVMLRTHGQQQSVTKMALQQQNVRRAHDRFVATFCRNDQGRLVSMLLQMNDSFWDECGSQREVRAVLWALQDTLATMQTELGLDRRESRALQQGVCWWLGRRAFVAVLARRRQSLPVYLFSLRGGIRTCLSPAMLLYPTCYLLCPLFVPKVHETLLRWARRVNQQQYVVRLLFCALKDLRRRFRPELKGSPGI